MFPDHEVVLASRNVGKLNQLSQRIEGETVVQKCDITIAEDRIRLVEATIEK